MKLLGILRHATAVKDAAVDDHDRPLSPRGIGEAARIGRQLARDGLLPDVVLSSPALRALGTARLVLEAARLDTAVRIVPELYGAEVDQVLSILRQTIAEPADRVLVVGHNPTLEGLVGALTGRGATLAPASLAVIELEIARWSELSPATRGRLCALWSPFD